MLVPPTQSTTMTDEVATDYTDLRALFIWFTQRNPVLRAWNLIDMAALPKRNGGIPAFGNQPSVWKAGESFDHPNPEYR